MKQLIVISLSGGLGNQMFQFASAYAFSKKNNASLLIDISQFDRSDRDHATYMLNNFSFDSNIVKLSSEFGWDMMLKLGIKIKFPYIFNYKLKKIFKVVIESSVSYSEEMNVFLNGNTFITNSQLQSYRYFHSIKIFNID